MRKIVIQNREFTTSILSENIKRAVERMAMQINQDYEGKEILFISILNGSFMFASDLVRRIIPDCEISFVKLTSYASEKPSGHLKELIGLNEDIEGRHVVVLEDIVDTGATIESIIYQLKIMKPASLKIATMLFKPQAYQKNLLIDYVGLEMPNGFLVGYGLDFNGYGRNLEDIYVLSDK